MKILVTAFEPFGGDRLNSAQETLKMIPDQIENADITKLILPVVFGKSLNVLKEALLRENPDAVLCLGQAGGRKSLTPERIAINISDSKSPDNDGYQPVDQLIFSDGPDAYFSSLPVRKIAAAIQDAGIPAEISNSAGTYVCNHIMYGLLYFLAHEFSSVKGGFIHLPYLTEQTNDHPGEPGLGLSELILGVTAAIRAIASEN